MSVCPCRTLDQVKPLSFEECCAPFITRKKKAPTAEQLMRSRYAAYVMKDIDYIDETQITLEHETFNKEEAKKWAESSEWLGLEIMKAQKGEASDNSGIVEFVARYKDKQSGTELRHHETALFQRAGGEWKFKEGHIHGAQPIKRLEPKIGRNDPCSCGSGKKFKKCCGA
jgi:SEC-C motif-containing protein